MHKQSSTKSDGPVVKIVVAVIITLLVGGSSPWWWTILFPKKTPKPPSLECSLDTFRAQLLSSGSDKPVVIKIIARTMRERFRLQDFDCVSALAAVLLQYDQDNGHGLYYSGEVWRVKAKQDPSRADFSRGRMREHFFRYLDIEPSLSRSERDGVGATCYQRERGYCAERTAWINHLMAIDYYQQGQDATDKETKLERLQHAFKFVNKDLRFGGFDQIIPSAILKRRIQEELQSLRGLRKK